MMPMKRCATWCGRVMRRWKGSAPATPLLLAEARTYLSDEAALDARTPPLACRATLRARRAADRLRRIDPSHRTGALPPRPPRAADDRSRAELVAEVGRRRAA